METKFQRENKPKRVANFSKNKNEYNYKTELVKQVHKHKAVTAGICITKAMNRPLAAL